MHKTIWYHPTWLCHDNLPLSNPFHPLLCPLHLPHFALCFHQDAFAACVMTHFPSVFVLRFSSPPVHCIHFVLASPYCFLHSLNWCTDKWKWFLISTICRQLVFIHFGHTLFLFSSHDPFFLLHFLFCLALQFTRALFDDNVCMTTFDSATFVLETFILSPFVLSLFHFDSPWLLLACSKM